MTRHKDAIRRAITQAAGEHLQPAIQFRPAKSGRVSGVLAKYESADAQLTPAAGSWCLLESPEGEYPRIRVFKKLSPLLDYLKNLEGTETAVLIVQGTPLSLSKVLNGDRYLLVGDSAIRVGDRTLSPLPQSSLVGLTSQVDGWLGDSLYPLDTENDENG
jgi:hypothetical protein